jgi:hypothetical protein
MEGKHFTTKGGSGIMNVVAAQPHVTLSGDRVGEYATDPKCGPGSVRICTWQPTSTPITS